MADGERLIRVIEFGAGMYTLAWSPDATRLGVGLNGGTDKVRVVTVEGRELWRTEPFSGAVHSLAWSPDGRRVAAGSHMGPVVVFDAASGTELRRIESIQHNGGVAWSPDSTRLAVGSGGSDPATVWVVEAHSGRIEASLQTDTRDVWGVDWSPDGSRLATGTSSNAPARILDVRSGRVLMTLEAETGIGVNVIRWAPSGDRIAFSTWSGGVRVCDTATGNVRSEFTGHTGRANPVAWSPDERVIASWGEDRSVRLWNPEAGAELLHLSGHTGTVWSLAFSPDGRVLASGGDEHTVRLWDVSDLCGAAVRVSNSHAGPEGAYLTRQLATVGRRPAGAVASPALDLWVPTGLPGADPSTKCLGLIAGTHHRTLDLFPDGRHLFGGTGEKQWSKWDLADGRPVWEVEAPVLSQSHGAAPSPDGSRVAVAAYNSGRCVSDSPGGALNRLSDTGDPGPCAVAWSADGRRLVWAIFSTGGFRVHDATTDERLGESGVGTHDDYWNSIGWSGCGRYLASGCHGAAKDGRVAVWEAATLTLRWGTDVSREVTAIRFSPDGGRLASGQMNGCMTLWRTETGQVISEHQTDGGPIHRFAWSPDGRFLAFTTGDIQSSGDSGDGILRVWDVGAGAEVWRCAGLAKERPGLAWASGGGFLAAGCDDGVRLFDVRHLMTRTAPAAPTTTAVPAPVPPNLRPLPSALAAVHRTGRYPPLSVLTDLLTLVAGRPPADPALLPLANDPGIVRLAGLRWPAAAHPALAALLLADLPNEPEWTPPPELPPSKLRRALGAALNDSEPAPADAPPVASRGLVSAAARVTPGVAAALVAVGPAACALDPSLPLRLAARPAPPTRRTPPRRAGLASASGGSAGAGPVAQGGGRAGSAKSGPPQAVNPWQWALPPTVLDARARRGELVYRAAPADPPVPARPAVVVLDTSAGAPGTAGGVLRAAAAAVLRAALSAGGAALVSAGGGWSGPVRSEADLAGVWSAPARHGRAGAIEALTAAGRWRAGLGSGAVLVVLAGPWFGWSEPGAANALVAACGHSGGRGAFAGPPGWSGRPALASSLFRWIAAPADRLPQPHDLLASILA